MVHLVLGSFYLEVSKIKDQCFCFKGKSTRWLRFKVSLLYIKMCTKFADNLNKIITFREDKIFCFEKYEFFIYSSGIRTGTLYTMFGDKNCVLEV